MIKIGSSTQQLQTSPMVNIFILFYYINWDTVHKGVGFYTRRWEGIAGDLELMLNCQEYNGKMPEKKERNFKARVALVHLNSLYPVSHQMDFLQQFFLHSVLYWRPRLTENTC